MHRRKFIRTTGLSLASVLMSDLLFSRTYPDRGQLMNDPEEVSAIINDVSIKLSNKWNRTWTYHDVIVELKKNRNCIAVEIQAPKVNLISVSYIGKYQVKFLPMFSTINGNVRMGMSRGIHPLDRNYCHGISWNTTV